MMDTLFSQKYKIAKIIQSDQFANYYLGELLHTKDCRNVIINEIIDRTMINRYLSDFIKMDKGKKYTDFVECFSEGQKLYITFVYFQGRNITKFLLKENLSLEYRIVLLKNVLQRFIDYYNYPVIVRASMLQPNNIIISENAVFFNFCLIGKPYGDVFTEKDIFIQIGKLIEEIISEQEKKAEKKLSILIDKCQKGLYESIGEVIRDLNDASGALYREANFKTLVAKKKKSFQRLSSKLLTVAIVISTIVIFYKNFIKNSQSAFLVQYVEKIGTVNLADDSEESGEIRSDKTIYIKKPIDQYEQVIANANESTAAVLYDDKIEEYVVKKNDSLNKICLLKYKDVKYIDSLAKYNDIKNKNLIYTGQVLKLPANEVLEAAKK